MIRLFELCFLFLFVLLDCSGVRSWSFPNFSPKPSVLPNLVSLLNNGEYNELSELYRSITSKSAKIKSSIGIDKGILGCWQVADGVKTGDEPNWKKYSKVLSKFSNSNGQKNRNFQYFGKDGAFTNLSEYVGPSCYAFTKGTYQVTSKSTVAASVDEICIKLFKFDFSFKDINGKGTVNIVYIDPLKRVLENEDGARVMQIKVDVPVEYLSVF